MASHEGRPEQSPEGERQYRGMQAARTQPRRRRWPPSGQAALGLVFRGKSGWVSSCCPPAKGLMLCSYWAMYLQGGERVGRCTVCSVHCKPGVARNSATAPRAPHQHSHPSGAEAARRPPETPALPIAHFAHSHKAPHRGRKELTCPPQPPPPGQLGRARHRRPRMRCAERRHPPGTPAAVEAGGWQRRSKK